ncbi:hypothetical protein ACRE_073070 [Hapsidospora chrysogenum ATCC 11550]|uniref:Secreted protein n=1 Tax=Hapsidospora chrysogenum (strain ATCC 11550 / CBS 779.69 / DSM 880 / IAM 14645 / JCM 23072 / IMI 49137) TaxID=857340 RepID=A0A086SY15_HAPC1|nr:hypothetical protein ACRE_073070 [Hapsidospora chrysogenum ATCC 11550]
MHPASILTIFALTGYVSAGCYGAGRPFGDSRPEARRKAQELCDNEGWSGLYNRRGQDGSSKGSCVNSIYGGRFNFWIVNEDDTQSYLSPERCKQYLNEQIDCNNGGWNVYQNPTFNVGVDPNLGAC